MSFRTLTFQEKDGVGVIQVNSSPSDQEEVHLLADDLADLCNEIVWNDELKVIVLTGAREDSFAIAPGQVEPPSKSGLDGERGAGSLTASLARLDHPLLAAVKGDATGPGLEMMLTCDLRIATEASHFRFPEIETGLIPSGGGTQRLSRLVGKGKALEMILTGTGINAQEAHRIGLINRVVPSGDLLKVAMEMAREMAARGPLALRYTKEAVYKGMDMTLEQGLRLEADLYLLLHTTKDRSEGISAFREKRTPRFQGR
jgi:enoyl-CoA hydratase/carnithine racemase